ncbi:MAG: dihydrofolate reductase [Odoribacteraceae bacterium]|jgi:dihydrofolate reductase|nr:dihydrofolate reductase [Odoribacteraceae bacterium]
MIAIIVAAAENGIIGKDNRMIWHLPADLKRFKRLTMGHTVVMGRRTFESIGRALPGRRNVVVSRDPTFHAAGCERIECLEGVTELVAPGDQLFVIGGESLYRAFWHRADRLYMTVVHVNAEGDTSVPPVDPLEWEIVGEERFPADDAHEYAYTFADYVRHEDR